MRHSCLLSRVHYSSTTTGASRTILLSRVLQKTTVLTLSTTRASKNFLFSSDISPVGLTIFHKTRIALAASSNNNNSDKKLPDEWGDDATDEDLSSFYDPDKTADELFAELEECDAENGAAVDTSSISKKKSSPRRVRVVSEFSDQSGAVTATGIKVPSSINIDDDEQRLREHGLAPQQAPFSGKKGEASTAEGEREEIREESEIAAETSSSRQYVTPVDPLLSAQRDSSTTATGEVVDDEEVVEVVESAIHPYYQGLPMVDLVEGVCSYLRATDNPKLVEENEEALLFPALLSRIDECSIEQLLQIIECPFRRSTMDRYGTVFKDLARDRILQDAEELSPELIHRAIIVVGISAGRRKRDLDFFKTLGKLLVLNINYYKDPNDLIRVMTAFNRAKIVPPNSFLSLMGRRFPVLNKKHPLHALPAYRVFSNMYRMGHDQMNPFRFLADRIYDTIFANLKKEKIRLKKLERAVNSGDANKIVEMKGEIEKERAADLAAISKATQETETYDAAAAKLEDEEQWGGAEQGAAAVRRRFLELSEVRPIHLTKLLMILARFGAPHQQYLRPLAVPLLIPSIPHFPPPSLTRLIRAMRLFKSTDANLYEAAITHMVNLGPKKVVMLDVLEVLRSLALPDAPVPANTEPFMLLCYAIFTDQPRLRARDMCIVASDLLLFSRKDDLTIPALDTMMQLVEVFARRMVYLLNIGVLSLTHAEILEDIARQLKYEDKSGAIAALREKRREINKNGDDEYYMMMDIDVRETLFKIQFVDNYNTYGPWRPIPGLLQVDFKQALTDVRVDYVLEAVDLYEKAYPKQLRITVLRLLSKSVLMKMSKEGEEVIDNGEIIIRPNAVMKYSANRVAKMGEMMAITPLKRVQNSPIAWEYLLEKATNVQDENVIVLCKKHLIRLEMAKEAGATQSSLEREVDKEHVEELDKAVDKDSSNPNEASIVVES